MPDPAARFSGAPWRRAWSSALFALVLGAGAAQAEEIPAEDLLALPPSDVVILGEVHDNPVHHKNQAAAVAALSPKAVVFEMLTEEQALRIRPDMLGSEPTLRAVLGWDDSGWPDFAIYYPIFAAAEGASIFGGGAPRDLVRRAVSEGAEPVFGGAAVLFGLDQVLDDDMQSAREALQFAAHCEKLPTAMLAGMVQAQRYRDAVLARAVLMALAEDGGPVVLITGNGHARSDWGVPVALGTAAPELEILSVGQLETPPSDDAPYDLWVLTEPVAGRSDPCEAFR